MKRNYRLCYRPSQGPTYHIHEVFYDKQDRVRFPVTIDNFEIQGLIIKRFPHLSGEKMESMGWKLPVGFEESLRKTVEWTVDNPEWLEEL